MNATTPDPASPTPTNPQDPFWQHKDATYRKLRTGLFLIALIFPVWLWGVGELWYSVPWQPSMSDYYRATPRPEQQREGGMLRAGLARLGKHVPPIEWGLKFLDEAEGTTPMRTWFVGLLFALGFFLIFYEGLDPLENLLLDLAGVCALAVAVFPVGCETCGWFSIHGTTAILAFVCLAIVAGRTAVMRWREQTADPDARIYRNLYATAAIAMVLGAGGAFVLKMVGWLSHGIFWAELLGLWAFGGYWLVLGAEMRRASDRLINLFSAAVSLPRRPTAGRAQAQRAQQAPSTRTPSP